jgi:hypothetical protein
VSEVTGHEEYIEHGWNGLVCDWDDPRGTGRLLDRLARDRRELHFLRLNALATAQSWPDWEQAGQFMALALERIRRDPPPAATAGAAQLLADVRTGLQDLQRPLHERRVLGNAMKKVEAVMGLPGLARVIGARHRSPLRQALAVTWRVLHAVRVARELPTRLRRRVAAIRARITAVPSRARAQVSALRKRKLHVAVRWWVRRRLKL